MDLSVGTKRLTNRKRAIPASGAAPLPSALSSTPSTTINKARKPVAPAILPANLSTPILGGEANFAQEMQTPNTSDMLIKTTFKEREQVSAKALRQRQQLPEFQIQDVSFTLFSSEELEQQAVFEVKNTNDEGVFSVNDPRSGTVEANIPCSTCHLDNLECPGHYGIIRLNEKIIHPSFRRETIYILMSVCNSCGGLLLPVDTIKEKGFLSLTGKARLKAIATASEKVPCRKHVHTSSNKEAEHNDAEGVLAMCIPNPVYKITKVKETGKIYYSTDEKAKMENIKSIDEVEMILDSISQEDAAVLGFGNESHPRRFIMKNVPVIPICARPPVMQDGVKMSDDITTIYQDIVKANTKLGTDLKEDEREKEIKNVIFRVEHLINNTDQKYRQGSKKVYNSIKERIQGKEAVIRGSIMGKRVNYSARTVLGPEVNIKFGQIRIPEIMAPYLTQHETVTPENINRLTSLLRQGKLTHVIPISGRRAGRMVKVNDTISKEHNLVLGDQVDRWLENGDYVVFNRQPTLHKFGMMGYEVVLGKPLTIGLHLGATRQHNADFDGDEGALHVGHSEEANKEIAGIMAISCNIMNAQNNTNIAGVVFDALVGAYILSLDDTTVDRGTFGNLVLFLEDNSSLATLNERLEKYKVRKDSGKALLSVLFPPDFYYKKGETVIREGILVSGVLDKDSIGASGGSIIQAMYKDYGRERTVDFLSDIYRMGREYMDTHGFSVGLDDCFLQGKDPQKVIEYEVQRASMLVKSMGAKLTDPLEEERREKQIKAYLDTAKGMGARISKENLSESNSFNIMAKSGAKGSVFNIAQITGILGQQFLMGERIPETLSGGKRALHYFPENSLDPEARGFVKNSFLTGLTPAEYFFHLSSSRHAVSESSNKVSDTGSIHHRIVKSLEDEKVYEDGSVRNAFGVILEFAYGEDGFDASMLESVKTSSGQFTSFINLQRAAGRINQKFGF